MKSKLIRIKEDILKELTKINTNINESVTVLLQCYRGVTPTKTKSVTECNSVTPSVTPSVTAGVTGCNSGVTAGVTGCNTKIPEVRIIKEQLKLIMDTIIKVSSKCNSGVTPEPKPEIKLSEPEQDFLNKYKESNNQVLLKEQAIKQFGSVKVDIILSKLPS